MPVVIEKYGIILRTVNESDADFIVRLRTHEKLGRFISSTSTDIEKQKSWIRDYLLREQKGEEYYFICTDSGGNRYGTYRIYDIKPGSFVCGSWVFDPAAPSDYAIKTEIACKEFAFEKTGAPCFFGENRKDNKKVNRYNLSYGPELIRTDELNYYYKFTRDKFEKHAARLLTLLGS